MACAIGLIDGRATFPLSIDKVVRDARLIALLGKSLISILTDTYPQIVP